MKLADILAESHSIFRIIAITLSFKAAQGNSVAMAACEFVVNLQFGRQQAISMAGYNGIKSQGYSANMLEPIEAGPLSALPCKGLKGRVAVPGDKSISHRALMLSTLCVGRSRIHGLLEGEDIMATAGAMRALGAAIEKQGDGSYNVDGVGGVLEPAAPLDFGNAGTGVRLSMGLIAAYPVAATFIGDMSLSSRPMGRVLEPLRAAGVEIIARADDRLPVTLKGPPLMPPLHYQVPVPSAQVKSALLLAALNAPGTSHIIEPVATRDHTERMLCSFGAELSVESGAQGTRIISVKGQSGLTPQEMSVPGDPSSAAFLIVAGLIVAGSEITIENVLINPSRDGILRCLEEMDGDIAIMNKRQSGGEEVADIRVRHSQLKAISIPADRAPSMIDEYPILAMAAAFAEGTTKMHGLKELRVKESDRLAAICEGLGRIGVEYQIRGDDLYITGKGADAAISGAEKIRTFHDHRIAMSFLIMGLAARSPLTIDDGNMIATSFPQFTELFHQLGAVFESPSRLSA